MIDTPTNTVYNMDMNIHINGIDPDKHKKLKESLKSKGMTLAGWYRLQVDRELAISDLHSGQLAGDYKEVLGKSMLDAKPPTDTKTIKGKQIDPINNCKKCGQILTAGRCVNSGCGK